MTFDWLSVDLLWALASLFFGWIVFMLNYQKAALIAFMVSIILSTVYVGMKL